MPTEIVVPQPSSSLVDQRPLNAVLDVETQQDTEWIERAHIVMAQLIDRGEPFTADNLRRGIGADVAPHHPNAVGALFNSYRARKQIVSIGMAQQSTSGSRNGGALRQWVGSALGSKTPTAKEYTGAYRGFNELIEAERTLRSTIVLSAISTFAKHGPTASSAHSMSHTRMLTTLAQIEELPLGPEIFAVLEFDLYDNTSPWARVTRHRVHIISTYRVATAELTDPIEQAAHGGALRLIDTAGETYSIERGLIMRSGSETAYGQPQLRLRDQR